VAQTVMRGALADLVGMGDGLRVMWGSFGFTERRSVLAAVVDRVTVAPTVRANNRFDPRRVDLTWRI
jgi:hypothetical protein